MSSQVLDHPATNSTAETGAASGSQGGELAGVEIVRDNELRETDQRPGPVEAEPGVEPRDAVSDDEQTVISKRSSQSGGSSSHSQLSVTLASSRSDLGNALEGICLGHFRLEKFVGGGGMGSVFRGTDLRLGRTVAIKVLSRDRTDPETLRRFQNEAQSAARLDHDNIARVYYVGEDQGLHFIVFEFIEGVNIRDLVDNRGPLPLGDAISYTLQVAEALEHASQRHVVHRDIKPSNVLVTAEGRAKLVDMGLARLRMDADRDDLTASGVTLGTFDYISPEQARDPRIADVRSDLYSLGCTFYFMLTGQPPFPEGTLLQKLLSHSSEHPVDPRLLRPDLDDQVVEILDRLLAKQPKDRYQQPNELIGELLLVADRLQLPGLDASGAVWLRSRRSVWRTFERTLPWLVPFVLLLGSVFAIDRLWPDAVADRAAEPPKTRAVKEPLGQKAKGPGPRKAAEKPPVKPAISAPSQQARPSGAASAKAVAEPVREPPAAAPQSPEATAAKGPSEVPATEVPPAGKASETPSPAPPAPNPETEADPAPPAASPPPEAKQATDPATAAAEARQVAAGSPPKDPSGAAASNPPAAPAVERIIVAAADGPAPPGAKLVRSLAAACREASALAVKTIELQFNGAREESPLDIASVQLTICSGAGFQPTVVFRPSYQDLAWDRRMIRVGGGHLAWQGVHVRMELPSEPADSWALFSLRACDSLDLQDAVLTIVNSDAEGSWLQDRVSLVEVAEAPPADSPAGDGAEGAARRAIPPYLGLSNCVARGQATLIRCDKAAPLRIVCRQSLLASPDWLLDVGGTDAKPTQPDARIDLALKNVTAALGQGLCRLSSDTVAPFQLDLVTDCKNSILYLTGSGAVVIERRGARELAELEKHLYIRGRDNFYPGSDILLRLNPNGDPQRFVDCDFAGRSESWYQEESPRFTLLWQSLPAPDVPADQHTPADYLLDESGQNPALLDGGETQAGVDTTLLPPIPSLDTANDAQP